MEVIGLVSFVFLLLCVRCDAGNDILCLCIILSFLIYCYIIVVGYFNSYNYSISGG